VRLDFETYEPRVLLSVFPVTNNSDTGPGSLRQAMLDANKNPGQDTISFKIAVGAIAETAAVPTADSALRSIARGPDGNLWFTEPGSNKIGRLTPSGTLTEFDGVSGGSPAAITAGPDGNLWFTDPGTNKIGKMTTAGVITEFSLPTPATLRGLGAIAPGPDGALWFVESTTNAIGRITTAGSVSEFDVTSANTALGGITSGPDGNLWFAEMTANKIGKMTTSGTLTEYNGAAGGRPVGIAAGSDGNLWFTDSANNKIGKITTSGSVSEFNITTAGSGAGVITSGPDNALWFVESNVNKIGRITTAGSVREFNVPTSASIPTGITSGSDGNVWFTENAADKIGRVTVNSSGLKISPQSSLPTISGVTALDASTQPGFSGVPLVQIDGTGASGDGIVLGAGSSGSKVQGLDITGFSGAAIHIQSSNDQILGNYLGTNLTGTSAGPGNQTGVWIDQGAGNTIGGTTDGDSNLIGFNSIAGVQISGASASSNLVAGNVIGTISTGPTDGNGYAVQVFNASNNTIGGTTASARNTIGFNQDAGVAILTGNGNAIRQNQYRYSNGPSSPVTVNDISLGPNANNSIPVPVIQSTKLDGQQLTVGFTEDVPAGTPVTLDFYKVDSTSTPQKRVFLGSDTKKSGQAATITVPAGISLADGDVIVASATTSSAGTSMFSNLTTIADPLAVINTNSSGYGSLAQAIQNASGTPGSTVRFDLTGPGPFIITIQTPLRVSVPTIIDARTQTGYSGTPLIQIVGGQASDGILLDTGSDGSAVYGLDIVGFTGAGIHVRSADDIIAANFIGTDLTGKANGPGNQKGVLLDGATDATVGGASANAANVFGFNTAAGISIGGTGSKGNLIIGNRIGTDTSNDNLHNAVGVAIAADGNTVGGTTAGRGNLIGFNTTAGLNITGNDNVILGNLIGTTSGRGNVGNTEGLTISGSNNTIGGTTAAGNTIGYSKLLGVDLISGSGNTILANTYLATNGPSIPAPANDIALKPGANGDALPPDLSSAQLLGNHLTLFFPVQASSTLLDVYLINVSTTPISRVPLGSKTVAAGDTQATISVPNGITLKPGDSIIATATDRSGTANGTSAFSGSVMIAGASTVLNTQDSGDGSLRAAIIASAGTPDHIVTFNISGNGPFIIHLKTPLMVSSTVIINARTQPGYNGSPLVQINGDGGASDGIVLDSGSDNSSVLGLDLAGFSNAAIRVKSAGATIAANFIGTDLTGKAPGGVNRTGILLDGASGATIGGTSAANANVIGFNPAGVSIGGTTPGGNRVIGNYIGVDGTNDDLHNEVGVAITSGSNSVGGITSGTGNFIGFNSTVGVQISGLSAKGNLVAGNFIGSNGTDDFGNRTGIVLNQTSENTIGGPVTLVGPNLLNELGHANLLGDNGTGISITGASATGNVVRGNFVGVDPFNPTQYHPGNNVGIEIEGPQNTIGGTTIDVANVIGNNSVSGIVLSGTNASLNTVLGNFIGTDRGQNKVGNLVGIRTEGNAFSNLIGGVVRNEAVNAASNVIGFNTQAGIVLSGPGSGSTGNLVQGNYIGTDADAHQLGNAVGIDIKGSSYNTIGPASILSDSVVIGSAKTGAGNIVSANSGDGIRIEDDASGGTSRSNVVLGNTVGSGVPGDLFPENDGNGIQIDGGTGNTVGGPIAASGATNALITGVANLITGNTLDGIYVTSGTENVISGNLISGNQSNGIHARSDLTGGATVVTIRNNFIGTNQAGTSAYNSAGKPAGNALSGVLLEETSGVTLQSGDPGAVVYGNLISGNGLSGVTAETVEGMNGNPVASLWVSGNIIGLDVTGTTAVDGNNLPLGNVLDGVLLNNVLGATVGGTAGVNTLKGAGNVISGNLGRGIEIRGGHLANPSANDVDNLIQGNYIGIDITGTQATSNPGGGQNSFNLGNLSDGIFLFVAPKTNIIGNTISNNRADGVHAATQINSAQGSTVGGTVTGALSILGNFIGTNHAGKAILDANSNPVSGNGSDGIFLDSIKLGATIGGTGAGQGNIISGNRADGIDLLQSNRVVVLGNQIGTDANNKALGNASNGVFINESRLNTIGGPGSARNIISGNLASGIFISGAAGSDASANLISGNYIGADASGTQAIPNEVAGLIISGADNNTIGGVAEVGVRTGNVISGNRLYGIELANGASQNQILGNLVGTDASGLHPLGNTSDGVFVINSGNNTIGGSGASTANVVSGNQGNGVQLFGSASTGNQIGWNEIGLGADGRTGIANQGNGVFLNVAGITLSGDPGHAAPSGAANQIRNNVISGNAQSGIFVLGGTDANRNTLGAGNVIAGNFIGTDSTGTLKRGNGGNGVFLYGSSGNRIGGSLLASQGFLPGLLTLGGSVSNLISGNSQAGIAIFSPAASAVAIGNVVKGNLIGTDATGTLAIGNTSDGVDLMSAQHNTIGGLDGLNVISGNLSGGVYITNLSDVPSVGNQVAGNYIGTDRTGSSRVQGSSQSFGVFLNNVTANSIGIAAGATLPGTNVPTRPSNVISGNSTVGVELAGTSSGNQVAGNYIGVDRTGSAYVSNAPGSVGRDLTNSTGVLLADSATGNLIGGGSLGAGNIISQSGSNANTQSAAAAATFTAIGVEVLGQAAIGNVLQGNLIGIDAAQNVATNQIGIQLNNARLTTVGGTLGEAIGGATGGAVLHRDGNIISGNSLAGVEVVGQGATGNTIIGNFVGTNVLGNARPGLPDTRTADGVLQPQSPTQQYGVYILNAPANQIGGAGSGNLFSGNLIGIRLSGPAASNPGAPALGGNLVQGNTIGTDSTGNVANPNFEFGVLVDGSPGNQIDGGNLISGNGLAGVEIFGGNSQQGTNGGAAGLSTIIQGNVIGGNRGGQPSFFTLSNADRTLNHPVVTVDGVSVYFGFQEHGVVIIGASSNPVASNIIAGNIFVGVYITRRDFLNRLYAVPLNNEVLSNTINTNGIYGVLRYDAPQNQVAQRPSGIANAFAGNPIALADYVTGFNTNSPQQTPQSILLPPGTGQPAGPSGSQQGPRGTGRRGRLRFTRPRASRQPIQDASTSQNRTMLRSRPTVPALFQSGSSLRRFPGHS
jgi:parallel beta-helix repeat protein